MKSNVSGFIEGYRNQTIKVNKETLDYYAQDIREKCLKLEGETFNYRSLPDINSQEDFGKWVAFGKSLENKIEFDEIELNDTSKRVILNYFKVGKLLGHKPIMESANKSAEIYFSKSKEE